MANPVHPIRRPRRTLQHLAFRRRLGIPFLAGLLFAGVVPSSMGQERPGSEMAPDDAPAGSFPGDRPVLEGGEPGWVPASPQGLPSLGGGQWVPQGPGPALGGQVEGVPGREVVGAVHTVAAHPTDPDVLYVGAANGGIWRTSNATSASPQWDPLTDFETSLSIGALEFDPTDATHQTLVAGAGRYSSFGGVGGVRSGLLKTTDAGASWSVLGPVGSASAAGISGVAPRGSTIVASANVSDAFTCSDIGIWRSVDGGSSFTKVGVPAGIPDGVAFDLTGNPTSPGTLFTAITFATVCTGGALPNGVYRSLNAGATWSKVSDPVMDALIIDGFTNNIEIAAHGLDVYVNIVRAGRSAGIFHSGDDGVTWTAMDLPRTPEGTPIAILPPDLLIPGAPIRVDHSASGFAHGLTSGMEVEVTDVAGTLGANGVWTISVLSSFAFSLSGSNDFTPWVPGTGDWVKVVGLNPREKPGSQGGIHAAIRVDPSTPTTVYIGGDRQDSPFPNFLGALDFTGRLFRGDTTVAPTGSVPSPQWEHLTHSSAVPGIPGGGTAGASAPHADSREMVFDANGDLIEVDDGGIYRRTSPSLSTGDWFSLNGNLQVTEIHDIAYDAISDVLISGNQDTGTTQQTSPGGVVWESVHTADGGDVAVDDLTQPGVSTRFSSFQNLAAFRRREYDSANNLLSQTFPALTTSPPDESLIATFVTPVQLNAITPTRLVIAGCNAVFESLDQGDTLQQASGLGDPFCGSGGILTLFQNALAYGGVSSGVDNVDVLYVGSGSELYIRTSAHPAPLVSASTYPGTTVVRDIVLDPADWTTSYVLEGTRVFTSPDAAVTWTDLTGNLTDTDLRSAAFVPGSPDRLVVGGRNGVFALTLPPTPPFVWGGLGTGLPNAPVWDLEYDSTDAVLVAGTMGRGAWVLDSFTLFADGFESGDTSAWSDCVGTGCTP
jgi:hypothetical protein